ncbi:MAG: hypothetical protein ACI86H_000779 [bacterium]|jgi:hypothetical protein
MYKFTLLLLFLISILSSCSNDYRHILPPKGFALFHETEAYKAVTPDKVIYKIRTKENKPFADLSFWKHALKRHMLNNGYHFQSEEEIQAIDKKGYLLDLVASLGNSDYSYLVAIFMKGKRILIVEAAGEVKNFRSRRKDIIQSIQNLNIVSLPDFD